MTAPDEPSKMCPHCGALVLDPYAKSAPFMAEVADWIEHHRCATPAPTGERVDLGEALRDALLYQPLGWQFDENGAPWPPHQAHAHHKYNGGCAICRLGDRGEAMDVLIDVVTRLASTPAPPSGEGRAEALLHELVDHETDPCRLDHHGYCQEHPGGFADGGCTTRRSRELLAAIARPASGSGEQ